MGTPGLTCILTDTIVDSSKVERLEARVKHSIEAVCNSVAGGHYRPLREFQSCHRTTTTDLSDGQI